MSLDNLVFGDSAKKNIDKLNNTITSVNALLAGGGGGSGGSGVRKNLIDNPDLSICTLHGDDVVAVSNSYSDAVNRWVLKSTTSGKYTLSTKTLSVDTVNGTNIAYLFQTISDPSSYSEKEITLSVSMSSASGDWTVCLRKISEIGVVNELITVHGTSETLSGTNNCTTGSISDTDQLIIYIFSNSSVSIDHIKMEYGLITTEYETPNIASETTDLIFKDVNGNFMVPYSNPNLIDNPDFKINLPEKTTYNTIGYILDRWYITKLNAVTSAVGSVTIVDDGVTLASTVPYDLYFRQYIEPDLDSSLAGKTVTASFEVTAISGSWKFCKFASEHQYTFSTVGVFSTTFIWQGSSSENSVQFYSSTGGSLTLKWVKLEISSFSTPFIPPKPSDELSKIRETNAVGTFVEPISNQNIVVNSAFDVCTWYEYGTTFSCDYSTAAGSYLSYPANGWVYEVVNLAASSQLSDSGGTRYFQTKVTAINTSSSSSYINFLQTIEDMREFRGKTLTFSAYASSSDTDTEYVIFLNFKMSDGSLSANSVHITSSSVKRYSVTATVPVDATRIIYGICSAFSVLNSSAIGITAKFADPKLEVGGNATRYCPPLIQDEAIRSASFLYNVKCNTLPFDSLGHYGRVTIPQNSDLNDYKGYTSGAYVVPSAAYAGTILNVPATNGGGWLNVRSLVGSTTTVQEYTMWTTDHMGQIYWRIYDASTDTWTSWIHTVSSVEYATANGAGLVSTASQTFAGTKTFADTATFSKGIVVPNAIGIYGKSSTGTNLSIVSIASGGSSLMFAYSGASFAGVAFGSSGSLIPTMNIYTSSMAIMGGNIYIDNTKNIYGKSADGTTNIHMMGITSLDTLLIGYVSGSITVGRSGYTTNVVITSNAISLGATTSQHTYIRGHLYLANGTTYYINNAGTAKLKTATITAATEYESAQVRNLHSGTKTPVITVTDSSTQIAVGSGAWYGCHS